MSPGFRNLVRAIMSKWKMSIRSRGGCEHGEFDQFQTVVVSANAILRSGIEYNPGDLAGARPADACAKGSHIAPPTSKRPRPLKPPLYCRGPGSPTVLLNPTGVLEFSSIAGSTAHRIAAHPCCRALRQDQLAGQHSEYLTNK